MIQILTSWIKTITNLIGGTTNTISAPPVLGYNPKFEFTSDISGNITQIKETFGGQSLIQNIEYGTSGVPTVIFPQVIQT